MCPCPAHNDKTPSLSVDDGNNGRPVVMCMAGCSQEAVIDALKARGTWPDAVGDLTCVFHGIRPPIPRESGQ